MLKIRLLPILLTLFFIMSFSVAWSQPIQKQAKPQSKTSKLTQQKTSKQENPPVQFVTPQQMVDAITRAIDASNEKYKTRQYPPPPDNSAWWFSLFLVIFTCGLVIVGGIQCYIIFNTLKETQIAAKAATDSARVAVNMMEHTQRAYVFIKEFIHDVKEVEGFGEIIIVLENTGETPVKNLIANFDYCVFSGEIPKDFDFPEKGPRQYGVIGRKATLDARVLIPFDVFKDARTKKQRLYIYGWVDYDDVFPNTPRHRTESCHEVIISKDLKFNYNIYGKHNGSDDECYRQPSPYTPPT